MTQPNVQFKECVQKDDIRVMLGTKEETHYLFVVCHFKDEVIGTHQIPDDYNLKPAQIKICMSTDHGKTTQKY